MRTRSKRGSRSSMGVAIVHVMERRYKSVPRSNMNGKGRRTKDLPPCDSCGPGRRLVLPTGRGFRCTRGGLFHQERRPDLLQRAHPTEVHEAFLLIHADHARVDEKEGLMD